MKLNLCMAYYPNLPSGISVVGECAVCLNNTTMCVMRCHHAFCRDCAEKMRGIKCPVCRKTMKIQSFSRVAFREEPEMSEMGLIRNTYVMELS